MALGGNPSAKLVLIIADVAQLVEHHLAKVRVAGSNPVVRSEVPGAVSDVLATLLDSPRGSCAPRSAP